MDHWEQIRKLIEARRADQLVKRIRTLDGAARKEVAARLPELLKALRGRFDRWDDRLVDYSVVLRVAGAGTIGGAAGVASWLYRRDFAPRWAGRDNDVDLLLDVLADRPAAWRADLANRLVLRMRAADDRGMALTLALLRETGVEPPQHDPLVAGWAALGTTLPGGPLRDDPLLDHLLPRLFEAEGVGRELQWEQEPHSGWLGALTAQAAAGRVKREALIEGCVRRFLRGGTPIDLRFFVRLHEALDPAPAEVAPHVRDYLSLLPASPGPVAELATKRLRACDGLAADDLAEAWESLLFRSERKLVRAGLSWLDRSVRRAPELAAVVATPLTRAFAADSAELQEKAVELALAHAAGMGEEGRATVREAVELLPLRLGHRVAAAFAGGTVTPAEPAFVPPPLPAAPQRAHALAPPAELSPGSEVERLPAQGDLILLLEEARSWQDYERLLADLVTLAGRDRARVAAALHPRLPHNPWGYGRQAWLHLGQWLQGAANSLARIAPIRRAWHRMMPRESLAAPHRLLLHRGAEILRAVEEDTLPPLLLATPTHSTGHVAAAELVRRMEVIEAAGAKPLAADFQQALLRLPRTPDPEATARAARLTSAAGRVLAGWTCPEVAVELEWTCGSHHGTHDWHDRDHNHDIQPVPTATFVPTGLPLVDMVLGVERRWAEAEHLAWWPSTLPSHREVAAAHLMPYVNRRFYGETRVGPEMARELARAEGPVGAAFAMVLARILGDPDMPESVDVLLETAARDELPAAEVGRHVGLLVAAGEVRVIDVTTALDAAARRGAHEHVWRIAAAALPTLLPPPGVRPRNGLAGFVTLAATTAEWCGARGEIPEVGDMAARKGTSGLLREARRLHDLLTGTGQEG
ncbi:DUF6493 family protein [Nonomuraea jiangxiensis]|uniref:DUF7824 domain-containing protein n=1 Tax=Nonomuraea jiangxiensis TaxID=633440 RepID=A0A1G8ELL9_9ACTN|nr:DUF6493 family protein [Nonomuraea jiangxiensis]SDH70767.1 hypothetical protein SAMN05421869_10329 [Nonomuraea jiangxiensis]